MTDRNALAWSYKTNGDTAKIGEPTNRQLAAESLRASYSDRKLRRNTWEGPF